MVFPPVRSPRINFASGFANKKHNKNATIEMPAGEVTLTATTTKEAKNDTTYKVDVRALQFLTEIEKENYVDENCKLNIKVN